MHKQTLTKHGLLISIFKSSKLLLPVLNVIVKIDTLFFGVIILLTLLWCYLKSWANSKLEIKYFIWFYLVSFFLHLFHAILHVCWGLGRALMFINTGFVLVALLLFFLWSLGEDKVQTIEYRQNRMINYAYPILGIFIMIVNSSINSLFLPSINDMDRFVFGSSMVLILFSAFGLCSIAPQLNTAFGSTDMLHAMIGLSAIIPAMYFGKANGWMYYVFGVVMFVLNSNLLTDERGYYINLSKIIAGASGLMLGIAAICFIFLTDVGHVKLSFFN